MVAEAAAFDTAVIIDSLGLISLFSNDKVHRRLFVPILIGYLQSPIS